MSQYSLELCSADSLHYLSNHSKPSLLLLRVILGLTSCTRLQLSLGTSVSLLRLVKAESQSQSVFCGRGFCKAIRLVVLEDLFLERPAKESAQQTESRGLAGKRWLLVPSFGYFGSNSKIYCGMWRRIYRSLQWQPSLASTAPEESMSQASTMPCPVGSCFGCRSRIFEVRAAT